MYPSAPLLLVKWTQDAFPGSRVATETPANLQPVLDAKDAVIRIERSGGPRKYTLDYPSIDVSVVVGKHANAAENLADADSICGLVANAWEWTMPGALIDAGVKGCAVVARVDITSGPSRRPVSDPRLAHVGFSAAVVLHSQRTRV